MALIDSYQLCVRCAKLIDYAVNTGTMDYVPKWHDGTKCCAKGDVQKADFCAEILFCFSDTIARFIHASRS